MVQAETAVFFVSFLKWTELGDLNHLLHHHEVHGFKKFIIIIYYYYYLLFHTVLQKISSFTPGVLNESFFSGSDTSKGGILWKCCDTSLQVSFNLALLPFREHKINWCLSVIIWNNLMNPNSYIGQNKLRTSFFFYLLMLGSQRMV